MRIGDLAQDTGVSTKTIRYYETIGVLPEADRAPNGYRSYDEDTIDRLRFVLDAQATGLSLTEIASILGLREQGASTCAHVTHLLEHHLEDLDRHIAVLQSTRTQLAALTERAHRLDPANCTDPNRCQTIADGVDTIGQTSAEIHAAPRAHRH
jgi:DNA-binding transcriptional MerR regulator